MAEKPHLQREIEALKQRSLAMGAIVEENLEKAATAVRQNDVKLAQEVIESDGSVDDSEVEVEEECLKILALHQPVAIDLRYVIAILKLNNDLERIGDLAVNIAEQVQPIVEAKATVQPPHLKKMVSAVREMVKQSLDSLVNLDTQTARDVCEMDDVIDDDHKETYAWFGAAIGKNPSDALTLSHFLSVSRYLERIADHATNIAEDVIYMTEGRIVRHTGGGKPGS